MVNKPEIVWTNQAKNQLKKIYLFYEPKSRQGAKNVVNEIMKTIKSIQYPLQYQADEIYPSYRRMIVRHYKILYKNRNQKIYIYDILDVRQNLP